MTNIALLFKADPEIPSLLKSFVMMGGVFDGQKVDRLSSQGNAEWNIRCDPHAADIVYRANVAVHRSIGLDVTTHVTMEAPEVRERFQNRRLLRPVLDFAEVWFNQSAPGYKSPERIIFHDPLAATTIFNDDICRFDRGNVKVELYDPEEVAVTRWTPRPDGGHEIAMDVNAGRFFDEYFGVFAEH
jgi:purine nucleosidase